MTAVTCSTPSIPNSVSSPNADSKLYLTFDYHDNEKGIPSNGWYFDKWKQWQISLVGEHRFSDLLKIKARAFYVDHEDSLLETDWDSKDWFYRSAYDNYSLGGEVQAFLNFGQWSFLKIGLSYVRDNCKQDEIATTRRFMLNGRRW